MLSPRRIVVFVTLVAFIKDSLKAEGTQDESDFTENIRISRMTRDLSEEGEGSGGVEDETTHSENGESMQPDHEEDMSSFTFNFLAPEFLDNLNDTQSQDYEYENYDLESNSCTSYSYGCCPNSDVPKHGPNNEGCCLLTEHGCCSDFIGTNTGESSCLCGNSLFGCCPDGITTRTASMDLEGCGCKFSTYGCCEDQYTSALGPSLEGCPCKTFDYGCCSDGVTVAVGPNGEGCSGCEATEAGCCPDKFTAALGGHIKCACAGSEYGCCTDGLTPAQGQDFQGCSTLPGAVCSQPKDSGGGANFTIMWFYDLKEGRCARFWYSGEGGNMNNFQDIETCQNECINPPGSARCYLPKIEGICTGDDQRWYYDKKYKQCTSFQYGGCLGNSNRFMKRKECEETCIKTDSLSICEQPLDAGPCKGDYSRWYYDDRTGECTSFVYGGCRGNKNRFMTKEECDNSCYHKRQILDATDICKKPIDTGSCNETFAKWGFNEEIKLCQPFYFSGCEGNENSFETRTECEKKCPNAFPPHVDVLQKIYNVEEGTEVKLGVNVSGNPFPEIFWQHNMSDVQYGERFSLSTDRSLVIEEVKMEDAGTWMVIGNNGLGKVVRKQISLSIYPSSIPLQVQIPVQSTNFEFGGEIRLRCIAEGYPEPTVKWLKNSAGLPNTDRITIEERNTLVIRRASPIDGGAYICRATNKDGSAQAFVDLTVSKGDVPLECVDQPGLANCKLVVRAKYCSKSEDLARICCQSCVMSGQIAGPPGT